MAKFGTKGRYRGFRSGPHAGKAEHVVIAENAIGHPLPHGAEIHHIDEVPSNNTPANLVVCQSHSYHMLLHYRLRVLRAGGSPNCDRICHSCSEVKPMGQFHVRAGRGGGRQSKCKDCYRILFQQRKRQA